MAEVVLTQADQGKSIRVSSGDLVIVRLSENPTTGYAWAIDQIDSAIVSPAGSDYAPVSESGIGGGGERIITFMAAKPGTCPIRLKLWRKWEGDKSVRQRFEVTVEVESVPS